MKKIATLVCAAFAALIMASCSNNSPEGVVKDTMKCYQNNDYKGMIDNMDFSSQNIEPEKVEEAKKQMAAIMEEKFPKAMELKGKLKEFKIVNVEMGEDGNTATVEVEETWEKDGDSKNETEKIRLSKDKDGNWKLKI